MSAPVREFLVSLPIADRRRARDFYRDVFGLAPEGTPTEDGVPEPLRFRLDQRTLLVLIPADGLDWVLGDRPLAASGTSECLLGLTVDSAAAVDQLMARTTLSGGRVLVEPAQQDWGYTGICADVDGHAWQITAAPVP